MKPIYFIMLFNYKCVCNVGRSAKPFATSATSFRKSAVFILPLPTSVIDWRLGAR